jgi:hypothetical protein
MVTFIRGHVDQVNSISHCGSFVDNILLLTTEIDTSKLPYQVANPEIVYYFERLFEPIVVATLRRTIALLPKAYELLPAEILSNRSHSAIVASQEAIQKQMLYRFNEMRMVLEGTRKRFGPGQEILKRPRKKTVAPADTPFILCQVKGCSCVADTVQGKCPDCHIYRCSTLAHFTHANHSQLQLKDAIAEDATSCPGLQPETGGGRGRGGRGRGGRSEDERDTVIAKLQLEMQALKDLLQASLQ